MIADPDICHFRVQPGQQDFVMLGCDGIFDKLEDQDCIHTIWQKVINPNSYSNAISLFRENKEPTQQYDHELCGKAVDAVMKSTALRQSADNITVVFIAFDSFF